MDVPLTMSPTLSSRSGRRVTVVAEDGADATILSSRGALPVREHDANPERLTLTTRLLREAIPADRTWRTLIDGITAVGGPRYDYRQIDPINNTDGPLSLSPGRIEPTDPAFTETRKSLAGEFVFRGTRLVVVANHLSAKRGDDPILGRFQPPRTPSTERRARQTAVLADFARQLLHRDRDARLVLAGDFNDTEYSAPLRTLRELGLTDLPATLPEAERYTYVFQGNAQVLDHILLSPALTAGRHDYDIVHVNAEFHDQVSDHDPQIVRLHVP